MRSSLKTRRLAGRVIADEATKLFFIAVTVGLAHEQTRLHTVSRRAVNYFCHLPLPMSIPLDLLIYFALCETQDKHSCGWGAGSLTKLWASPWAGP